MAGMFPEMKLNFIFSPRCATPASACYQPRYRYGGAGLPAGRPARNRKRNHQLQREHRGHWDHKGAQVQRMVFLKPFASWVCLIYIPSILYSLHTVTGVLNLRLVRVKDESIPEASFLVNWIWPRSDL